MQNTNDIVTLNVGGCLFSTARSTLLREPNSVLARLFSLENEPRAVKDAHGNIFIDRDGTHFRYILNYLRSGAPLSLPEATSARNELLIESRFYGLDRLADALEPERITPSSSPRDFTLKPKAVAQQETITVIQQSVPDYIPSKRTIQKEILKAIRSGQGFVRVSLGMISGYWCIYRSSRIAAMRGD